MIISRTIIIASLALAILQCRSNSTRVENTGPNAPSNLIAWARSSSSIQLGWQDNSALEDSFIVYRRATGVPYLAIGSAPMDAIFYIDSSPTAGTAYSYYVKAANENGLSSASNIVDVRTPVSWSISNTYPPDSLICHDCYPGLLDMEWECSHGTEDTIWFDIYFGTQNPPPLILSNLPANSYPYNGYGLRDLSCLQDYFWKISAHDQRGNSLESPVWTFRLLRPVSEIWSIDVLAWRMFIDRDRNFIYTTSLDSVLRIVDTTNLPYLLLRNSIPIQGIVNAVESYHNLAYIAAGDAGLQIFNIFNIEGPYFVGSYPCSSATNITVNDQYAFLSLAVQDLPDTLKILDVSNPASPQLVGDFVRDWNLLEMKIAGNYAYIATSNRGLQILDITDPAQPQFSFQLGDFGITDLMVVENYLYYLEYNYLKIVDIHDPSSPVQITSINTDVNQGQIAIAGNYAYLADMYGCLQVIDITDPFNPVTVSIHDQVYASDILIQGDYIIISKYPGYGNRISAFRILPPDGR